MKVTLKFHQEKSEIFLQCSEFGICKQGCKFSKMPLPSNKIFMIFFVINPYIPSNMPGDVLLECRCQIKCPLYRAYKELCELYWHWTQRIS